MFQAGGMAWVKNLRGDSWDHYQKGKELQGPISLQVFVQAPGERLLSATAKDRERPKHSPLKGTRVCCKL